MWICNYIIVLVYVYMYVYPKRGVGVVNILYPITDLYPNRVPYKFFSQREALTLLSLSFCVAKWQGKFEQGIGIHMQI